MRRLPGRIAGQTHDLDGRRGLRADAADARAAHPPREGDLEHLHRAGAERARRDRLPELARAAAGWSSSPSCWCSAPPTRASGSTALTGVALSHNQPVVREFPIRIDGDVDAAIAHCLANGHQPRLPASPTNELLVAITEQRTRADIDRLADTLEEALA